MSKYQLFLKLANPDENGFSRVVNVDEFIGEYASLKFGNGGDWCRKSSTLCKKYIVKIIKNLTNGNSIDAVQLCGFNTLPYFNQTIRKDIVNTLRQQPCVIFGVKGFSENTVIEIDHKDGQKNDERVSNVKTQKLEDFQPMCKATNDVKREICKRCKLSNIRWDARQLDGFPIAYYKGGKELSIYGCEGCYWYDPVAYRKEVCKDYKNNS